MGHTMMRAGGHVVFIHGLWLHADSWAPWMELFRAAGYAPVAPGWPGDSDTVAETRGRPGRVAGKGIDELVGHYAQIIRRLDTRPVVIGHSVGGLIAQRLLGQDLAAAGVAIDAAPIKGVIYLPPSALRVASVALRNPANRNKAVALTPEQFCYGFGNALPARESAGLYERWTVPSPGKPLFEAATANLSWRSPARVNTRNKTRGPLLLIAGGNDRAVPAAITRSTRKLYYTSPAVTDLQEFNDRGHSLTIDHGWREIADAVLSWLGTRTWRDKPDERTVRHSWSYPRPAEWFCIYCGWKCTEGFNDYICKSCHQIRPWAGGSATMISCSECGQLSLALAKYCEWCGNRLPDLNDA